MATQDVRLLDIDRRASDKLTSIFANAVRGSSNTADTAAQKTAQTNIKANKNLTNSTNNVSDSLNDLQQTITDRMKALKEEIKAIKKKHQMDNASAQQIAATIKKEQKVAAKKAQQEVDEIQQRLNNARKEKIEQKVAQKQFQDSQTGFQSELDAAGEAYRESSNYIMKDYKAFDHATFDMTMGIRKHASVLNGLVEGMDLSNSQQDKLVEKMYKTIKSKQFDNINKHLGEGASTAMDFSIAIEKAAQEIGTLEKFLKESKGDFRAYIVNLKQKRNLDASTLSAAEEHLLNLAETNGLETASNAEVKKFIQNNKKLMIELERTAANQIAYGKMMDYIKDKTGVWGQLLQGQISHYGMLMISLDLLVTGIKGMYDQLKIYSGAGFFKQYFEIAKAQTLLGISAEQAAKMFQESSRYMMGFATVGDPGKGLSQLYQTLQDNQIAMRQLGLSAEEAAQATNDFAQNAIKSGINVKDAKSMNKLIDGQRIAFTKLKATTGVTYAEFKALNEETMHSASVQSQLNGTNQKGRLQQIQEMNELRQHFVNMGMSAQTAQKALMAMQDLGKEKLTNRWEQAAKIQQAASILGMDNATELGDMVRKGSRRLTQAQKEMMQSSATEMQKRLDTMKGGDNFQEMISDALDEGIEGPFKTMMEAGREQQLGADALGVASNELVEAAAKLKETPEWFAKMNQFFDTLGAIITNPFMKVIGGLSLALLAFAKFAKKVEVGSAIGKVAEKITGAISGIVTGLLNGLKSFASGVKTLFTGGGGTLLKSMVGSIQSFFANTFELLSKGTTWTGILNSIKSSGIFSKLLGGVKFLLKSGVLAVLVGGITAVTDAEGVLDIPAGQKAEFNDKISAWIIATLKSFTLGIFNSTIDGWRDSIENINWDEYVIAGVTGVQEVLGSMRDFASKLGIGAKSILVDIKAGFSRFLFSMKELLPSIKSFFVGWINDTIQYLTNASWLPKDIKDKLKATLGGSIDIANDEAKLTKQRDAELTAIETSRIQQHKDIGSERKDIDYDADVRGRAALKMFEESDATHKARMAERTLLRQQEKDAKEGIETANDAKQSTIQAAQSGGNDIESKINKLLGITSLSNVDAVANQVVSGKLNTGPAPTTQPGVASVSTVNNPNGINAAPVNTATSTDSSGKQSMVVTLSDESLKKLAEFVLEIQQTSKEALSIEKTQAMLLEALVESNESSMKHLDAIKLDLRSPKLHDTRVQDSFSFFNK